MILFVCSRETDYLQDLTYAGLAEVLGKEKVWDFPHHWQYHRGKKAFWNRKLEYPHNLGYADSDQICSITDLSEAKLVVLASAKADALEAFLTLIENTQAPWVFVDGGDRSDIGGDFERTGGKESLELFESLCFKRPPAAIFKRELMAGQEKLGIFPFPFSFKTSLTLSLPVNKKYDVAFWATESSSTRKKAFEILKGRYDCDANGSVAGKKSKNYSLKGAKYFEALASAKIALSFRGEGFDTLRYWEIPACGSFIISEEPSIQIPNNFENGKHATFCKPDLSDLTDKIDYYLSRDKEREAIAEAGRKHLLAHHTHLHRARYFIQTVKERLKLDLTR
ncbi:MAG: hypothetical protein A2901_08735 [Elusimicrobia bacterium RIFCSPLOWO2_01_FULL_54_10]|nr:MAG: hypothetical protein A2901_08735 [Elusimicrobia bacterium RIFCSPLOWO2_01_FULL_54_10]